ncbi:MAG: chaperone modulator CbpM [Bacteroidetes bacterium]|nr:chaperone modulator CbpM [Bacteroidota bacterium]MBS1633791.1 chaperone modulator CbpM [Bacteroidota bacterium]
MNRDVVYLTEFCSHQHVELSFIHSLEEYGLIETLTIDQSLCIYTDELPKLERIVRLHRDLNINPEGIDVINLLLQRMENMQQEMNELKNRLDFYSKNNE